MNNYQAVLLSLLKSSLFDVPISLSDSIDWSDLFQEAVNQTVVGLVAPKVKEWAQKRNVSNIDHWVSKSDQLNAYFVYCFQMQRELINLYEDNGIPIVIVKGYAAAVNYPTPQRRTMGDIDFLVMKDRFEDAKALMEKAGYKQEGGEVHEDDRHIGFVKNNVSFEMHRTFGSFGLDIDSAIEYGIKTPSVGTIADIKFPVLPPLGNGLVLIAHIRQHLLDENHSLGLRQIIDWMMYVNKYSGRIMETGCSWDESFLTLAESYRLDTLAITVTYICSKMLGLPNAPGWCDKADKETAEELLDLIMISGNFGSKREYNNTSVKSGLVLYKHDGILKRLQNRGLVNWKASQKYPILRPFAWMYQGVRVMRLGIAGIVSNNHGFKQICEGNKKGNLLKKLGI